PGGSQPKLFPALLPTSGWDIGGFHLRFDNVILLVSGSLLIAGTHLIITRTRLGLAIRAVAQDEETARTMGIDFRRVVLVTFALGSALAAFAGVIDGLYYNEVFFGMGLLLGVIGFAAYAWLLLRAESQGAIAALILVGIAAGILAMRTQLLRPVVRSLGSNERFAQGLAFAAVVVIALALRDDDFALLLLTRVLIVI